MRGKKTSFIKEPWFLGSVTMKKHLFAVGFLFLIFCLCGCFDADKTPYNQGNGKDSTEQYLWSTMNEGPYWDKISFAISTDLLNWTDSKVVLAEHASVPGAVYKDGVIYVYFVDVSVDGLPEQISLIRSTDNGLTWLPKEHVVFTGLDNKVPVDPAPVLLDDGSIRLYYFDINEERTMFHPDNTNKIYSAVSKDGVNFTQEKGVRFSRKGIYDPDVVKVNGTWRMYVGDISNNMVISAISSDGLTFTEEGVVYEGGVVPDVFFEEDIYYLYTAGVDIAISQDGAYFSKTSYSFHSHQGKITADPSIIKLDDGTYMMFYKFRE